MNRCLITRAIVVAAGVHFSAVGSLAVAQSGVPGGRLDSGRDHRARVHAETYVSVATFLARWRAAWEGQDAAELIGMYAADAIVRLPGQSVVRTHAPLQELLQSAVSSAAPLSTADVDFHTDGETAFLVSCYFTRLDGRDVVGLATAVLLRTSRSWRLRAHIFDVPQPAAPGVHRFSC